MKKGVKCCGSIRYKSICIDCARKLEEELKYAYADNERLRTLRMEKNARINNLEEENKRMCEDCCAKEDTTCPKCHNPLTCAHCVGAKGGKKSKRTITKAQQRKMQEARKVAKWIEEDEEIICKS